MKLNSHTTATLLIMAFNLIWLLPLALVVLFGHINAFAGICLAYLPAIYAAHKVRAGKAEE
jgi:Fuc2NAc and GlcNAc transferase